MRTAVIVSLAWILICLSLIPSASALPYNFVARGDVVWTEEYSPQGTCWYFPNADSGYLYDQPSLFYENKTWCQLGTAESWNLSPGIYTLIYEAPTPANGKYFKDVSWVNNSLVSAFSAVHSVDEAGKDGPTVMRDLKRIISSNGFNTITESQVIIQDPDLRITQLEQTATDAFTISGISNLANETPILIKVDENRYLSQHNESFTYHTAINRPATDVYGYWTCKMNMAVVDMPPGWHNVTVYAKDLVATSSFKLDIQDWSPNPTPTGIVKYLSGGNIAPVTITIERTVVQTKYVDRWHTATPTPDITDALGEKVAYPYEQGEVIPSWVGIGCLILIAVIVLFRGRKWK